MDEKIVIEAAARACHEVNRAYCLAQGDTSQKSWEEAGEEFQNSARSGVKLVLSGSTPDEQHQHWMETRLAAGWKYGAVKNTETKEHPCLVPYNELPVEQRAKDVLFMVVASFIANALENPEVLAPSDDECHEGCCECSCSSEGGA